MTELASETDLLARSQSGAPLDQGLVTDNPILSPILSFAHGAYSFPQDWWLSIHWVLGMQGVYGERMQRNCQDLSTRLYVMLNLATRGFPMSYKLASVVVDYLLHDRLTRCTNLNIALQNLDRGRIVGGAVDVGSAAVGRFIGGSFTAYVTTGGRFGRSILTGRQRLGPIAANFLLASFGALIRLAIETRGVGVTVADMAIAIFTGRAAAAFNNDQWATIVRAVQQCSLQIDAQDQESFRELFNTMNQFHEDILRSVQ